MASGMYITGEWGSVAMHLTLCRADGDNVTALDTASGGGVVGCTDFEAAFFAAAGPWFDTHGAMPVILAGMIGSNIGWQDSGYAACPAGAANLTSGMTSIRVRNIDIHFTPGLKCRNIFNLPDVIRGEEMQVLGWLSQAAAEQRVVCLPGRHVKWLLTGDNRITSFFTGMTGELEDLLLSHGLLGKGVSRETLSPAGFTAGLDVIATQPELSVGHALFSTRSRLVLGDHRPDEAAGYLTGLLIGADIRDSMRAHREEGVLDRPVILLGHGKVKNLYASAFKRLAYSVDILSDAGYALAGFRTCFDEL